MNGIFKEYVPRKPFYDDVYRISMTSKNGRQLYLSVKDFWYDKKGELHRIHEWTWDRTIGIQFDSEKKAEEYGKKYFKNFDGWYVDVHSEYQGSM